MSKQDDSADPIREARLWRDQGWTAVVIKNNDGEGWAVAMTPQGQTEPALVGPWTMGRDKVNPKPLDSAAFNTLVKTANEVVRRHEQQQQARLHKGIVVNAPKGRIDVTLDILADEHDPHGLLAAHDELGALLAKTRVSADFQLDAARASAWVDSDFTSLD